jgi:hypothetical protein
VRRSARVAGKMTRRKTNSYWRLGQRLFEGVNLVAKELGGRVEGMFADARGGGCGFNRPRAGTDPA